MYCNVCVFCLVCLQTELTCQRIQEFETQASSDLEVRNNKIDELNRTNEELRHQLTQHQKTIDQHKLHINKCIDVVKKLLKEKSSIEKKEARQKCMQNRLRLGQFVTQRVGATFQENWTDGHAFQELARFVFPSTTKYLLMICPKLRKDLFHKYSINYICIQLHMQMKLEYPKLMHIIYLILSFSNLLWTTC